MRLRRVGDLQGGPSRRPRGEIASRDPRRPGGTRARAAGGAPAANPARPPGGGPVQKLNSTFSSGVPAAPRPALSASAISFWPTTKAAARERSPRFSRSASSASCTYPRAPDELAARGQPAEEPGGAVLPGVLHQELQGARRLGARGGGHGQEGRLGVLAPHAHLQELAGAHVAPRDGLGDL